jgi:hypothetical protein
MMSREEQERALRRTLESVMGLPIDHAIDILCRAFISVARVTGRSKEEVTTQVKELLAREASPGVWRH